MEQNYKKNLCILLARIKTVKHIHINIQYDIHIYNTYTYICMHIQSVKYDTCGRFLLSSPNYPIDPSPPRNVTITGVFQDGVELNWLPPTEPNGVVHFSVVVESRAGQQIRKSCGPRHCNATALQEGVTYSIMVVATTAPPGAPTSSAPLTHKHMHTTAAGE